MFKHEKLIQLTRAIALKGYFINEMPIVVQEGSHYVVIEGNRRITACKVLLEPELAPKKYQSEIKSLVQDFDIETITKLSCVVAPSRDEAKVIIQNRHMGGSQVERWDGMRQDRWYVNDMAAGYTIETIAQIYAVSQNEVLNAILRYKIYHEATQIPNLSDKAFRFVNIPEKFPISTMWRVVANKNVASFLGLKFTSSGEVEILLPIVEYGKRFAKIIEDLANKKITSRTLNTADEIAKYLEKIITSGAFDLSIVAESDDENSIDAANLIPVTNENAEEDEFEASTTDNDADKQDGLGEGVNKPTRTKVKRASPKPKTLISYVFKCQTTIPRIDEVFNELKTIPLSKPNAIAVLFRTLLELLMTRYVEDSGLFERIKDEQVLEYVTSNRKIEENLIKYLKQRHEIEESPEAVKRILKLREEVTERWFPSLGFMIKFFSDNAAELIPNSSIREAFQGYVRQQATVTHSEFNSFVHNPFFRPDSAVLQEFWGHFAPFINFLISGITSAEEEHKLQEA